jgi:hypothetical protein
MFSQLTPYVLVALSLLSSSLALPAPAPKSTHVVRKNAVTLPFVRHYNLTGTNLLKSDQARAKYLKTKHLSKGGSFSEKTAKSAAASIGVGITNAAVTYTIDVRIFSCRGSTAVAETSCTLGHCGQPTAALLSHRGHWQLEHLGWCGPQQAVRPWRRQSRHR